MQFCPDGADVWREFHYALPSRGPGSAEGKLSRVHDTHTHTCVHAYIHTYLHTHVHAYLITCIHTHTCSFTHYSSECLFAMAERAPALTPLRSVSLGKLFGEEEEEEDADDARVQANDGARTPSAHAGLHSHSGAAMTHDSHVVVLNTVGAAEKFRLKRTPGGRMDIDSAYELLGYGRDEVRACAYVPIARRVESSSVAISEWETLSAKRMPSPHDVNVLTMSRRADARRSRGAATLPRAPAKVSSRQNRR